MIALSNSVHLYVRPEARDRLLELFGGVLGLQVVKVTKAYVKSPEPMYAVRFPNGASISVESTANALSEEQAARGAWLELRSDDADGVQRKSAGVWPHADHASVHAILLRASAWRSGLSNLQHGCRAGTAISP
jgi:hypothetical protein